MKLTTKKMVVTAMMIALSVILSFPQFKINGSIGFDALPAFLGAIILGPILGGVIGFIGHMTSAALTGFLMTPLVHFVVAIFMFISCALFGVARLYTNRYVAVVVGIVLNAPVTLAVAAFVIDLSAPGAFTPTFMALILPLTIASSVNVIMAEMIYTLAGKQLSIEQ